MCILLSFSSSLHLSVQVAKAAKQLHVGQGSQHLHALYLLTQPFGSKALYPTGSSSSSGAGTSVDWRLLLRCLPASEAEARAALASASNSIPNAEGATRAAVGAATTASTLPFGDSSAAAASTSAALAREERAVAKRNDAFAATAIFESYDWYVM